MTTHDNQAQDVVLVTGATGTVGRHLVDQLVRAGHSVRALTRTPVNANVSDEVDVVFGDLTEPETLRPALSRVTKMHLIPIGGDDYSPLQSAPEILALATEMGVERVTVMTGTEAELTVVQAVEAADVKWTHLRPTEFMAHALEWIESIRASEVVRVPFARGPRAMVHEADIASVAMTALLEDGHAGRTYTVTGPEVLTKVDAIRTISDVIGRDIQVDELTLDQTREQMRALDLRNEVIDAVIEYGIDPPEEAYTVLPTVKRVTGRPARTFAEWADEHAEVFQ